MHGLIEDLLQDLEAETAEIFNALDRIEAPGDSAWTTMTECPPWNVKDQLAHLAWNDTATVWALTDPERFLQAKPSTPEGIQAMVDSVITNSQHRSGPEVAHWFRTERTQLLAAVVGRDPRERIPWYGPDMSVASKLTARFMETWAHGYDITNALGVQRKPTDRVRHVVFLGLQALPNAYSAHGLALPEVPVRVEVLAPSGAEWSFGRANATNVIRGSAFELAQVVTRRIHPADTSLRAEGSVAVEWLGIAQAFAGPPGNGPSLVCRRD
jgi:uncharacterized protein (TIGR03084 family)